MVSCSILVVVFIFGCGRPQYSEDYPSVVVPSLYSISVLPVGPLSQVKDSDRSQNRAASAPFLHFSISTQSTFLHFSVIDMHLEPRRK